MAAAPLFVELSHDLVQQGWVPCAYGKDDTLWQHPKVPHPILIGYDSSRGLEHARTTYIGFPEDAHQSLIECNKLPQHVTDFIRAQKQA